MNPQERDWQWMDAGATLSLVELSTVSAISTTDIEELMGYGALQPLNPDHTALQFSGLCVVPLRKAEKLRRDYDLDLFTVVIMMDFLQHIDRLESQLTSLQAQQRG